MLAIALEGGFPEPVLDAQSVFRSLMEAMAHPGRITHVDALVSPPTPLNCVAGVVACTLIDADTPFWLDARLSERGEVATWIGFQTDARVTPMMEEAAFALLADPQSMPSLNQFAQGTQEYPDRSSTLILQLQSLDGGEPLSFEGPGIDGRVTVAPRGLPADFTDQWGDNRARFPRGVDLILAADNTIICLPRSARLVQPEA